MNRMKKQSLTPKYKHLDCAYHIPPNKQNDFNLRIENFVPARTNYLTPESIELPLILRCRISIAANSKTAPAHFIGLHNLHHNLLVIVYRVPIWTHTARPLNRTGQYICVGIGNFACVGLPAFSWQGSG